MKRVHALLKKYDGGDLNALKERIDLAGKQLDEGPIKEVLPLRYGQLDTERTKVLEAGKSQGPGAEDTIKTFEQNVNTAASEAAAVKIKRAALDKRIEEGLVLLKKLDPFVNGGKGPYRGEFAKLLDSLKGLRDAETAAGVQAVIDDYANRFEKPVTELIDEMEKFAKEHPNDKNKLQTEEDKLQEADATKEKDQQTLDKQIDEFGRFDLLKHVYSNYFKNADIAEYKSIIKEFDTLKKARKDAIEYRSLIDRMGLLERRRDMFCWRTSKERISQARKEFAKSSEQWNLAVSKVESSLSSLINAAVKTPSLPEESKSHWTGS